jgi:PKD repeat protein
MSIPFTHGQDGVKNGKSVFAKFDYAIDTVGDQFKVDFKSISIGNIISVSWDFGDGEYSHATTPSHIYTKPGVYDVTLRVVIQTDSQLIQDKETKKISIAERGYNHLGGHVFAGLLPINEGFACLYSLENDGVYPVDTAYFDTLGFYWFYHQNEGDYLVKIDIPSTSLDAGSYLPTYYGDEMIWTDAERIEFNLTNWEYNIHLIQATELSPGIGQIGGNISYGEELNAPQTQANNIPIILIHEEDNSKSCVYSNEDGVFDFSNIELGEYKVHAEVTGKKTIPHLTYLSQTNPQVNEIDLIISTEEVYSMVGEEENHDFSIDEIRMYPNPSRGDLTLHFDNNKKDVYSISVVNNAGQQVFYRNLDVNEGINKIQLNLTDIQQGSYFVSIRNSSGTNHIEKLIIH